MSRPRGQHLVAQLYQRGFAAKAGKIWQVHVLNRATGEGGLRNVRNVFKRRDWNTVIGDDGEPDFGVEEALATHVDDPAAPALAELRAGNFPLDPEEEVALVRFMAAQLVRGREVRENLSQVMGQTQRQLLRLAAQHYTDEHWERLLGEVPTADEIRLLAENEKHVDLQPTTAALLNALFASVDEYAELLAQRKWTLVSFDQPSLFSGEHPVVHIIGAAGGYGIGTAERFHFPISTNRSLILSPPWSHWPEQAVHGTTELAGRLNWATFTHPANDELLMHPEVAHHPLPDIAVLDSGGLRWPWGKDPDVEPPPSLELLAARSNLMAPEQEAASLSAPGRPAVAATQALDVERRTTRQDQEAVAMQQARHDEIADSPGERHAADKVVGVLEQLASDGGKRQ